MTQNKGIHCFSQPLLAAPLISTSLCASWQSSSFNLRFLKVRSYVIYGCKCYLPVCVHPAHTYRRVRGAAFYFARMKSFAQGVKCLGRLRYLLYHEELRRKLLPSPARLTRRGNLYLDSFFLSFAHYSYHVLCPFSVCMHLHFPTMMKFPPLL